MNRTKEAESLLWRLCAFKSRYALEQTAYALCLTMEDRTRLAHVTKGLYLDVAKHFRTSWRNVERNIRNVRDTIWDSGERNMLIEISGGKIHKRPTSTEFLEILTDYLLDQEMEELAQREEAAGRESVMNSIVGRITASQWEANERAEIARLAIRVRRLEEKNRTLKDTVQRLHDLIWDMVRKSRDK